MLRRSLPLAILAGLSTLILFIVFWNGSWRSLPQAVGLGESYAAEEEQKGEGQVLPDLAGGKQASAGEIDPNAWRGDGGQFKEPKVDAKSPYPMGKTKPAGSNYTRRLVVPKLSFENTSWIEEQLGDIMATGELTTALYEMDHPSAPLHPVKNKGHEAMAYLSYMIDFYDELPDVSIFMHSHRYTWHNNEILDQDAAQMVRRLSPERVTREGYMHLRCHWDPGCPDWMHPGETQESEEKKEQHILAAKWAELFPRDPIPTVLAQPCCAQFALSRERILSIPKSRLEWLRDWVLRTELSDYLSGRIFEYVWQYIFTASPIHCPSMSACYCDGYGICFGDAENFDYYFELNFKRKKHSEELDEWNAKARAIALAHEHAGNGMLTGEEAIEVPELGRDRWLTREIEKLQDDMRRRKEDALERGKDPRQRAKEAGRPWKEGDGF